MYDSNYVNELVKSIEKKKSESFKKAKAYLESENFFEKNIEEKKDFLNSENGLILLEGLSTDKLTILSISNCLGVTQKQLHTYMKENPEIYDAVDRGRAKEFDQAEKALMDLATGYYKTESKTIKYTNERGSEATQTHENKRWFPPNYNANAYYLNNKKQLEYKEKQIELETLRNTIHIEMEIIGDDEVDLS